MKYYYVYDVEWSQTNKDTVIIYCKDTEIGEYLKKKYKGARYFSLIRKTDYLHIK